MEMGQRPNETKEGPFTLWWFKLKALPKKLKSKIIEIGRKAKELGEDDPRRIIHSFKVGLAISLVSTFYYFDTVYQGFGVSAMWAVMTVVVIFEFSVGATLGKGVNRGVATLAAGGLGVGAHRLASFSGDKIEPLILGLSVFFIAAVVTFARFFPRMKARYDYGLMIFILTFSLISVSGYRDDEVLDMAQKRLSTILIGGATAMSICIFIRPVWAGDDLHNMTASNLDKLASFLEGFGDEYFKKPDEKSKENQTFSKGYESVLNSKSSEETLANFAKWEPHHGRIRYRHPWEQYLKIGALTRQCAYISESLNSSLNTEIQTPQEIRAKIQDTCKEMISESSNALKEVALSIQTMTRSFTVDSHIMNARFVATSLKSLLETGLWEEDTTNLLEIIPVTTVASLLLDIVTCIEKIVELVHELAPLARFKNADPAKLPEKVKSYPEIEVPHHIISYE
ncbi:hypothetical protein LguiB_001257 [Lonicera macranthoides]